MAASLSTLDSRRRVHRDALGLKWTLAPSPCISSGPSRSCPREGGQNSHMHMEQPLTHTQCARKRSWKCVHARSDGGGTAALCICLGGTPLKGHRQKGGLTQVCVHSPSLLLCGFSYSYMHVLNMTKSKVPLLVVPRQTLVSLKCFLELTNLKMAWIFTPHSDRETHTHFCISASSRDVCVHLAVSLFRWIKDESLAFIRH